MMVVIFEDDVVRRDAARALLLARLGFGADLDVGQFAHVAVPEEWFMELRLFYRLSAAAFNSFASAPARLLSQGATSLPRKPGIALPRWAPQCPSRIISGFQAICTTRAFASASSLGRVK